MQNEENRISPVLSLNSAFCLLHSAFLQRSGQALIESCLAIGLICLLLCGLFQLSRLYSAREIALYACALGARAQTVGFNDFMIRKTVRVAAIPDAGKMTFPETAGGPPTQMAVERGRIPLYLGGEPDMLDGILQYEDWETIGYNSSASDLNLNFSVSQNLPLRYFPTVFQAFYNSDMFPINAELSMDNHASLYLE